jgi:hypothetical protein
MSSKDRDIILLASAKENLRRMAFYGLCEYQKISQYLFESTFHLNFLQPFVQLNETHSTLTINKLSPQLLSKIRQLNHLDIELYEFSKQLLFERFKKMKSIDENLELNYENSGLSHQTKPNSLPENSASIESLMSDYDKV